MRVVTSSAAWCLVSHKKWDESGDLWHDIMSRKSQNSKIKKSQNHKNELKNLMIKNFIFLSLGLKVTFLKYKKLFFLSWNSRKHKKFLNSKARKFHQLKKGFFSGWIFLFFWGETWKVRQVAALYTTIHLF